MRTRYCSGMFAALLAVSAVLCLASVGMAQTYGWKSVGPMTKIPPVVPSTPGIQPFVVPMVNGLPDITQYGQLNSGTDTGFYMMDAKTAATLNIPVLLSSLSGESSHTIMVFNHLAYKLIPPDDDHPARRLVAGVRWIVDVKCQKGKVKTDLPAIAADVQAGRTEAKVMVQQIGMNSTDMLKAIGVPTDFTLETYVKLAVGIQSAVQALTSQFTVAPQLEEMVDTDIDGEVTHAALRVWAMQAISQGMNLKTARDNCPIKDPSCADTLKTIYLGMVGSGKDDGLVLDPHKAHAKALLQKMSVSKTQ